ncbi:MAG TPA: alcohol dehydrogenase catalytic domain-containing protein [Alphaproteobacteria bacterium]|nr:alcohol dehydrogenase catalytic domain-containing protein [Alphaproteobacteria bacterium]
MAAQSQSVIKERPEENGLALRTLPLRELAPDDVLIQIHSAAICGTDIHIYKWNRWAARTYTPPFPMGHEFSGKVVAVGRDVARIKIGDAVTAETHIPCGHCAQCRMNRRHTCENMRLFSRLGLGCMAEFTVVPEAALRTVPPDIPIELATMMEPMGVAVRAAREIDIAGADVLVLGCGPIGLFAIGAARAFGAGRIVASEPSSYRRALALSVGADAAAAPQDASLETALSQAVGRTKVDAVIDTSGNERAVTAALDCIRSGGDIVFASLPEQPFAIDVARHVVLREITLRGIYGRRIDETWLQVENLLRTRGAAFAKVLTHRLPLARFDEAFALACSGEAGKVVLLP